jgi:predicted ATP-binding protein involved in virulence
MRSVTLVSNKQLKINSLKFTNFRGIKNVNFNLEGKSAVFFGINGVGKSSILRGINLLFSRIINKIVKNRFKQGINIELSDISTAAQSCTVSAELFFSDNFTVEYHRSMERKAKNRTHIASSLESIGKYFEQKYSDADTNMPIFVNYGVNRLVLDVPVRIKTKHIFDREAAFEKAIENRIDFRTFFAWFRYQEDFENQQKVREKRSYEDIQLKAVRTAILNMFDSFSDLRIERHPLSMKINKGKTTLSVEQLSDGEKCTLSLIGDLARRLSLANPSKKNPLHGEGVVLIDEIELHMHPAWQRDILSKLKITFPNIQFIITTHSPQVLGEVGDDFTIFSLIIKNGDLEYSKTGPLIGWDSNYILEDFMYTTSLSLQTKGMINSMYDDYKNGDYKAAKEKAQKLEEMTNSAHEDVVKINILLERIENKK